MSYPESVSFDVRFTVPVEFGEGLGELERFADAQGWKLDYLPGDLILDRK